MQLVITVDLEKADLPLDEIFQLIGDCRLSVEAQEEAAAEGASGLIKDSASRVIGEWQIEEAKEASVPLESTYRNAAIARYARPRQVEVDRFATVSPAEDGAFVQGWLYVPRTEALATGPGTPNCPKPPESVSAFRSVQSKAG